ncbi:hypothetical protein LQZ18_17000 [Lachnospiraceae bacterium ZAX-1]
MTKNVYINEDTRIFNMKGIKVVANLDNASVIGLSAQGSAFFQNLCKERMVEECDILDNAELYQYLTEYEVISKKPITKEKIAM